MTELELIDALAKTVQRLIEVNMLMDARIGHLESQVDHLMSLEYGAQ